MLPADADPKTVELTRMIWTVKGGKNAAGMLMPVGGGRERKPNGQFSESVIDAAIREMIEETHAKTKRDRLIELPIAQQYTFTHKESGERRTQVARYCIGRLLPGDNMYPLDQVEDKIARFEYLTPSEYKQLVNTGSVERDGKSLQLVDHMQPSSAQNTAVQTDWSTVDRVHETAEIYFDRMEAIKKMKVAHYLLNGTHRAESTMESSSLRPETRIQFNEAIATTLNALLQFEDNAINQKIVSALENANSLWRAIIENMGAKIPDIQKALEHSNTEGVVENVAEKFDMETGKGIPSISLIFPLLAGDKTLDTTELRILLKNPQAARLLKIVGAVRKYKLDTTSLLYNNSQELIEMLFAQKLIPTNRLSDINRHTNDVDGFFEMLQQQASAVEITDAEPIVISVAEEVRGRNIDELLQIIFHPDISLEHIQSSEKRGVILWEAKRKLVLMLLMAEIDQSQQEIIHLGTQLFRDIEQALLKPDAGRGNRVLELGPRNEQFPVQIWSPPKSLAQALRKVIARDRARGENRSAQEFLDDANRSAYVFDIIPENTIDNIEVVKVNTGAQVYDANGKVVDPLIAQKQIAYLIAGILRVAATKNIHARIINYKPLPLNGEGFASSGGGGKGNIRMAKFDLEIIRPDGIKQYKEYQIFVPGMRETAKTEHTTTIELYGGEDDFEDKKADDKTRSMRRLFDTQGVRSAMEALFPVSVYGDDIRKIYRHRVGSGDKIRDKQTTEPPIHRRRTGTHITITSSNPRNERTGT